MGYKTSRKEAIDAGETRYIGSPCTYGHGSIRYTGNWECIVCRNERRKKYRIRNKAKIAEAKKRYRQKYPELKRAEVKRWRLKNPEKRLAQKAKHRASKLNRTPAWLRPVDFRHIQEIYAIAKRLTKETGTLYHVDHIIPLRGKIVSGLHVPANLRVIKATDNIKKHNFFQI